MGQNFLEKSYLVNVLFLLVAFISRWILAQGIQIAGFGHSYSGSFNFM